MCDPVDRLEVQHTDHGWILAGDLDAHTAPMLAVALSVRPDATDLVIDMAAVEFMDSSGLRVLLIAIREAQAAGRSLVLAHPQPAIRRVVEVSGLSSHIRFGH
jgi:anti-sigma B factor antagonist